jgi:hypothetical protein
MNVGAFTVIFDDESRVLLCHRRDFAGGELATTDEADAFSFFAIDGLPENATPPQIERIRDALARGRAMFRAQTGTRIRDLFPGAAG